MPATSQSRNAACPCRSPPYAGQLNPSIVADEAAVPDAETFAAGVPDALGDLGVLAAIHPGAS